MVLPAEVSQLHAAQSTTASSSKAQIAAHSRSHSFHRLSSIRSTFLLQPYSFASPGPSQLPASRLREYFFTCSTHIVCSVHLQARRENLPLKAGQQLSGRSSRSRQSHAPTQPQTKPYPISRFVTRAVHCAPSAT